jgi:ABC-2 type transport system ATP-binding protein
MLINDMAEDKAIIISTHILEEVNALCNRNVVIANGKVKFNGTPQELEAMSRFHNAVVVNVVSDDNDKFNGFLQGLGFVGEVEALASGFRVYPNQGQQITVELSQAVRDAGWQIDSLYAEQGRLDEVFRTITINNS